MKEGDFAMPNLNTAVVVSGASTLTLGEFLAALHRRQRLRPLLVETAIEKLLVDQAREAGLAVSTEQLQQAVNRFRQERGLHAALETRRWLSERGLELPDLETTVETELLIEQLQRRLTESRATDYFAVHKDEFARARLRQLLVASEGEAREIYSQLTEEGRDFAELARQNSLHLPTRAAGGSLAPLCRCELAGDVGRAVFSARPGQVVGPFPAPTGYSLYLVEELLPAELDPATTSLIRRRLFNAYVSERFAEVRPDLSWLEQPDVAT